MNSIGSRSFKGKPQEKAQKGYFAHKDNDILEDEYLDQIIRRLFREWLAKIDNPPKFRIDTFQGLKKGFHHKRDKEVNMLQNDWYLLYHMQNEHRLDLIREAELGRMLTTSIVYVPRRPALYRRLFYWIGRLLIALGTRLTKRFEPVTNDFSASISTI
jgi:hypothetical protein